MLSTVSNLNGRYRHVDTYFVLAQRFESGHRESYVVEVFDRSEQAVVHVVDEAEDLQHLRAVSFVAVLAEDLPQGVYLGEKTRLEFV